MKEIKSIRYSTVILKYPTNRFGLAGAVPQCFAHKVYDSEQQAIEDLLSIGLTKFQKSDTSFYDENGKTIYDLLSNNIN